MCRALRKKRDISMRNKISHLWQQNSDLKKTVLEDLRLRKAQEKNPKAFPGMSSLCHRKLLLVVHIIYPIYVYFRRG